MEQEHVEINKALSASDVFGKKYKTLAWKGEWLEAFANPENTGVWFIWGNPGNGKSTFAMQLCCELSKHGKVLYNSLEMGSRLSFKNMLARMPEIKDIKGGKLQFVSDTPEMLGRRLLRPRSADFIVIDSFQYFGLSYSDYKKFKERHSNRLIIFISHASGAHPLDKSASKVAFDAELKIWVEGYKAFSKGRFIGANGGIYTIWKEGADKVWGQKALDAVETN